MKRIDSMLKHQTEVKRKSKHNVEKKNNAELPNAKYFQSDQSKHFLSACLSVCLF